MRNANISMIQLVVMYDDIGRRPMFRAAIKWMSAAHTIKLNPKLGIAIALRWLGWLRVVVVTTESKAFTQKALTIIALVFP
ncbi:hypothetical protein [Erythrobacter sp. YT30]|uniref:hypothetical protein n=1 Tax=Erythrobacter sp. YT30 TaxID=1735012 RepID=UPI00076BF9D5|nr:hypothetical protein [Erythrobacter sp. YT30]KWV90687.1 hypothetical protein AUC45_04815 [Erythrobacter sp. YT30]